MSDIDPSLHEAAPSQEPSPDVPQKTPPIQLAARIMNLDVLRRDVSSAVIGSYEQQNSFERELDGQATGPTIWLPGSLFRTEGDATADPNIDEADETDPDQALKSIIGMGEGEGFGLVGFRKTIFTDQPQSTKSPFATEVEKLIKAQKQLPLHQRRLGFIALGSTAKKSFRFPDVEAEEESLADLWESWWTINDNGNLKTFLGTAVEEVVSTNSTPGPTEQIGESHRGYIRVGRDKPERNG